MQEESIFCAVTPRSSARDSEWTANDLRYCDPVVTTRLQLSEELSDLENNHINCNINCFCKFHLEKSILNLLLKRFLRVLKNNTTTTTNFYFT